MAAIEFPIRLSSPCYCCYEFNVICGESPRHITSLIYQLKDDLQRRIPASIHGAPFVAPTMLRHPEATKDKVEPITLSIA